MEEENGYGGCNGDLSVVMDGDERERHGVFIGIFSVHFCVFLLSLNEWGWFHFKGGCGSFGGKDDLE